MSQAPIKVLIVDDSMVIRTAFKRYLDRFPDIEVVGAAPDPYVAREEIHAKNPDVLLLDIEMPKMDGVTFLKKLTKHRPTPTIMVSSLTPKHADLALNCLAFGAVDVVGKPDGKIDLEAFANELADRVRAASKVPASAIRIRRPVSGPNLASRQSSPGQAGAKLDRNSQIILIGASTGGPEALCQLLASLPAELPGIVLVQHMPPSFTPGFARRLNESSRLRVLEAQGDERIEPGKAILAPGDRHARIHRDSKGLYVRLDDGPEVSRHRPSVNVLFQSAVDLGIADKSMAVILTGMGDDGASAMLALQKAGCFTIAQDEESSVVYGMPRMAAKLGAANEVHPLSAIPERFIDFAQGKHR